MKKEYFLLYLIYGLVFIVMGIFASYKKDKEVSHLYLVRSLKYLGVFGIIHGISEWVTMVQIANIYRNLDLYLFVIKQFLKASSFFFLMVFGTTLLPKSIKHRRIVNKIPIILFVLWGSGFALLMAKYGLDYHFLNPKYNTILLRYLMAVSGGTISAIALSLHGELIKKRNLHSIGKKYKHLAYIFLYMV